MADDNVLRFRCSGEFKAQVEKMAKSDNRTVSNFIKTVLEKEMAKMKKYRMIDLSERNTRAELKAYTLNELKAYFTVDSDEYSNVAKMSKVNDILDLEELLKEEADGMALNYEFEEV